MYIGCKFSFLKIVVVNESSRRSGVSILIDTQFLCILFRYYKVLTPVEQFFTVSQQLKEAGIKIDTDNSGLELFPVVSVEVSSYVPSLLHF